MMNQFMEPEFAFATRRNNSKRYNIAAEEQEQTKNIDKFAAEKEGTESKHSTAEGSQSARSRQKTSEQSTSEQTKGQKDASESRQDTSKQQAQSSDASKSTQQVSESSQKDVKGSRKHHEDYTNPKYYTYSYSKSYRNYNGESYSTERYEVDTPNLKFTAEKPENAEQFQIEYEKTGEEESTKNKKVQKQIPENVEDDLHKMMSRINTELNSFEADFWHTPFSRRWSPFGSIEREFDRDFQTLFSDIESEFGGSRRRLEDTAPRKKKALRESSHSEMKGKEEKAGKRSTEKSSEKQTDQHTSEQESQSTEESTERGGQTGQTKTRV